jgi:pyrimidine-nucleoside phosphorylase
MAFNILDLIERKKQRGELSPPQITELIQKFTAGEIPPYKMAAFLMAVWFQGLNSPETVALTAAMLDSGSQVDLSGLDPPTADKHSTGGVGDKVSLLLAPLAAACGLKVPMLSGRGLGHTAGTLDKLESIPGYRINLSREEFVATVSEVGCAIVGQSHDIAPADGKMYALRDVTGTIDCVPLITASILCKKLAAGPENIVIDLKTGSGAFMGDLEQSKLLAQSMIETAGHWNRRLAVVFSDMSQPLGQAVGHSVEAIEAFASLRPEGRLRGPVDLIRLTEELVVTMLTVAGLCQDRTTARRQVRQVWDSGRAFETMEHWVSTQGGRLSPEREDFGLSVAPHALDVTAPADGHISHIACREIGYALGDLGGARRQVEETIDHAAGILFYVSVGDAIVKGQPLASLHCRDQTRAKMASQRIRDAITLTEEPAAPLSLLLGCMGPDS